MKKPKPFPPNLSRMNMETIQFGCPCDEFKNNRKKNKAVASAAKSAKKKAHNGKFGKVTKKKNLK